MPVSALTAVRRVISFLSLSCNRGRHSGSLWCSRSPRWATMRPMQEMARSFTSWSMSDARNRWKQQP
jgi:hypothetical protein